MARPHKQTVDYFPHDTDASEGKTLTIIQSKYGNDGYSFWFKLLQILGKSPGHYYNFNNPADWEFLLAKTHINDTETAKGILDTLSLLGAIDPELYYCGYIWSDNFVKGIEDAYNRSKEGAPKRPSFLVNVPNNGVNVVNQGVSVDRMEKGDDFNPLLLVKTDGKYNENSVNKKDVKAVNVINQGVNVPNNGDNVDNNPEITTLIQQTKGKLKETKLNKNMHEHFETFWKAYPKKKSKGQAEKAFAKISPDGELLSTMLVSIGGAKKSSDWLDANGKYIPYPATWLNAKGWEDEYLQEENGGTSKEHRRVQGNDSKESIAAREQLDREITEGIS